MSQPSRRYIVGPAYDWCFFLLPPLLSLLVGIAVSGTWLSDEPFFVGDEELTWVSLAIGTLIQAHLLAVVVRSHGNPAIRKRYPVRFLVVPALVWLAILASPWLAVTATIVATLWDVWHSGAQTFGFARIYDRNRGNPPAQGRLADFWLSQVLYAGPILGGVTLIDHVDGFDDLGDLGATFFHAVPAYVRGDQRLLSWGVILAGGAFLLAYVGSNLRLYRQGYRVSGLKVFLLASTGACSIYTWGFNTWGEAFLIMNLFHAVQYLALVWAMEGARLQRALHLPGRRGQLILGGLVFGSMLGYGLAVSLLGTSGSVFWALTIVVSLMHFWYDGFIWSVSRRAV
ncbi:hypothetical protein [Haliangium ochraceum]|uniref:Transmembrane protein n=1 Tax=Haliangium ochraceum (strain DSM 14365 / JCM 11303 / SMP-2) TaxID=502025 RepID=D0LR58_HALO1|nr:hypothetical protein [Haliangium ochraceum]ACY15566.1 conserved hypothetical protein [Haliangium ochraceum DSM 14365]